MISYKKLLKLDRNLLYFPFHDDKDDGTEMWPQIPIRQATFALMSDEGDESLTLLVKAWFTVTFEFTFRKSSKFITACPNHPSILFRTPKPGVCLKCHYCDFFFF